MLRVALLAAAVVVTAPLIKGLTYRTSIAYVFASRVPYVAGPVQAATAEQPSAELAPVQQFKSAVGLQYDFSL